MFWHNVLGKNYGWELYCFRKELTFKSYIQFIDLDISFQRKNKGIDHSPAFNFYFRILNFQLVEFNIYYLHHRDTNASDEDACMECEKINSHILP